MRRDETFVIRLTREERSLIVSLAKYLQRSQSDAVRFVVLAAARELLIKNGYKIHMHGEVQETQKSAA